MSEIINIEIQADQSGAEEALKQVNKSLKEGTEAAEALNHVLDGDLAGAFKSLGELSKTLGIELDLAFSPAEVIAFVQVIAEVADKLSKLIADTFIYTDAMKEADSAQKSLNQRWVDSAARIKAIGREMQITAEKTQAGQDALRLKFKLEDIGGSPDEIRAQIAKVQKDIEKATTAATETETHPSYNARAAAFTVLTASAVKAKESLVGLNLALSDLQRKLQLAEAVAAQGAQVLGNDYGAAADKAVKDKKREQDALDAWVGHAVRSRGTLTEAVKKMAEEQAKADIDANLALAKSEDARIAKINADEQAAAEEERQRQDEVYKGAIEVAKLASDRKIQLIEQDLEKGKINQQQEIAQIAQEKERELEIEKLTQQKRWALWTGDVKKQQEIQNQIDKIIAQSKLVQTKAVTDGLKVSEQQWKTFAGSVSQSLNSALSGWIQGTETFGQAWGKMADDMAMRFIQSLEKQLVQFLVNAAVRETVEKTQSQKSALRNAIDAAGKAYHWAAAWGGPPAGAISAAIAFTAVEAFGSAEGGQYYVPNNQLTMLHPQEMVLPAGIANQMRSVIGGGGSGGSGLTVVVNHSVSAVDAASFQGHIRRHSNMIANEVTRALKRKGIK